MDESPSSTPDEAHRRPMVANRIDGGPPFSGGLTTPPQQLKQSPKIYAAFRSHQISQSIPHFFLTLQFHKISPLPHFFSSFNSTKSAHSTTSFALHHNLTTNYVKYLTQHPDYLSQSTKYPTHYPCIFGSPSCFIISLSHQ